MTPSTDEPQQLLGVQHAFALALAYYQSLPPLEAGTLAALPPAHCAALRQVVAMGTALQTALDAFYLTAIIPVQRYQALAVPRDRPAP